MSVRLVFFFEYLFYCIFLATRDWDTFRPVPPLLPSAAIREIWQIFRLLPSISSGVAKEGGLPNRIILPPYLASLQYWSRVERFNSTILIRLTAKLDLLRLFLEHFEHNEIKNLEWSNFWVAGVWKCAGFS
jgi:hypothetical protein